MHPHVERAVVGAREREATQCAPVGPLASVPPQVARELVAPPELPAAARPRARESLLLLGYTHANTYTHVQRREGTVFRATGSTYGHSTLHSSVRGSVN